LQLVVDAHLVDAAVEATQGPVRALAQGREARGGGDASEVEGTVDAYCRLLLELSQALGGSFIHHQVQGLV